MFKTLLFNGVIFFGGLVFIQTFYNEPHHRLFGCSYMVRVESTRVFDHNLIMAAMYVWRDVSDLAQNLAGYPMYLTLLGINGQFFGPIAEKAYQVQARNNNRSVNTNIVSSMASTIYTAIFYINCSVFAAIIRSLVPYFGFWLAFLMNCAVMAYYCFEYGIQRERRKNSSGLTYMYNHLKSVGTNGFTWVGRSNVDYPMLNNIGPSSWASVCRRGRGGKRSRFL